MSDNTSSNKRIAKNTILLYFRTLLILIVSLYTSRVVLNTLGVDDYGIYQAVGGVVAMFSVISGALSNSISRFITFSLGKGDKETLNKVFVTSINIQVIISIIVLLLCEIVGVWFLNCKMNIPPERIVAANWVLQCSLITFVVGLISTPYNACIIAHEHMSAFAYVSILDAVLKLVIIYALCISPYDKLITYSILLVVVSLIIRFIYGFYCGKHFEECKYRIAFDKGLFKEMAGFAGWNFFTNAAYIFNTQGVSILVNMYFGVALNAARGIAAQVDGTLKQFIENFTMAVNPQITKSYAAGETERFNYLICKGARFSFFLLLIFFLPLLFETKLILTLWLKTVPEYTVIFVRLALIGSLVTCLGTTGYTACMATGNIKKYVLWITLLGSLVFVLTWFAYWLGCSVVATYWIYIIVYIIVQAARLMLMKQMLDFHPKIWLEGVLGKIWLPTVFSLVLPFIILYSFPENYIRLSVNVVVSILSSCAFIYLLGLTKGERITINNVVLNYLKKIKK